MYSYRLYVQLQTLCRATDCVYSYRLYVQLQTVYIATNIYFINCIINCSIVSFLHFPHINLLIILYIHLQNLKYIKYIIKCNNVPYSYFPNVSVSNYPVNTPTDFEIY